MALSFNGGDGLPQKPVVGPQRPESATAKAGTVPLQLFIPTLGTEIATAVGPTTQTNGRKQNGTEETA